MTDLHAAIRAKLDQQHDTMNLDGEFVRDITSDWRDALLAGLDLHRPDAEKWPVCVECSCDGAMAATECHQLVEWPCPTLKTIAEKLGIPT